MKKLFMYALLFLVVFSTLTACTSTATAITLPDALKTQFTLVVVAIVSYLFTKLITLVPFLKWLDAYREPLALGLAAYLIDLIETSVPDAYGGVAIAGLTLLLAILSLFKFFEVLRAKEVKFFRTTR